MGGTTAKACLIRDGAMPITDENETMGAAVRMHVTEQGGNPRQATLIAFGGAGPLHACHLAAKLRVGRVMVPLRAGVLSALGLLVAPPAYDIVRTHKVPLEELDAASAGTLMEEMADSIAALPGSPPSCHTRFAADSKYHQLDRELSALGPTTNLTTTAPILPQQRRSAGCFSYPSRPGENPR